MLNFFRSLEVICYYLAGFYYCWPLLETVLQMFQQNRYEIKRYFDWQSSQIIKQLSCFIYPSFIALLLYLGHILIKEYWLEQLVSIVIILIAGYVWSLYKQNKKIIKPLVFTNRVKRQVIGFVLIDTYIIFLLLNQSIASHFLISLLAPLNLWLVYFVAFISLPLEKLFHRRFKDKAKSILKESPNLKIIGITGSYGKTTTKNIVYEVLSQKYYSLMTPESYNTPMGIAKSISGQLKPIHQTFICEMGADKVGDITQLMDFVQPTIGIVTSIGPAHLASFKNQNNIINEKMQIIEKLPINGYGILNYDNKYIRNYVVKNRCQKITYGIDSDDVDYQATTIKYSISGSTFVVIDKFSNKKYKFATKLLGINNIANILAAICVGRIMDIEFKDLIVAVANVKQIPHRLEIKPYLNYTMIDDAFNSNPVGSKEALAILKIMPNERVLITCGMIDMGEQQSYLNKEFGKQIFNCADQVILVGKVQTQAIYQGLQETGYDMSVVFVVNSTLEALALLPQLTKRKISFLIENDLPDAFNR